jgi:DNA-binding winged helix-turn-helix (wHTH) protein
VIYLFSLFELDEENFCLTKDGQRVPLEPKSLRVLLLLVKSEGRLLEKNAILEAVWKDTFVEETTLTRAIALLRKQLGDDPRHPMFIETIPTLGYRFIAAVQRLPSGQEHVSSTLSPVSERGSVDFDTGDLATPQLSPQRSPAATDRRAFLWTAAAALVAGAGIWFSRSLGRKPRQGAINLILPLPSGAAAADPGRLLGPPVIAPDGSAVVVSLKTANGEYLFIRRLDTNRLVRMEGTENAVQPFWSPDSQHIAFFGGAKLKRIPVIGGSAVVL